MRITRERSDNALKLSTAGRFGRERRNPQRLGSDLKFPAIAGQARMASVHDEDSPRNGRRHLLNRAQKLTGQRKTVERGVSGEVPRRSRSIGDKAVLSRTGGRNEHDRNFLNLLLKDK